MPSPLAAAIDDLLAFLHSHPEIHGDDRERFDELDSRIYVEAHRLGILDQLPRPSTPPSTPYEACDDCLGKTNVFGFWQDSKPPNAKGVTPFMVIRETQWQTDITALRALGEAMSGKQPAGLFGVAPEPDEEWSEAKSPAEWKRILETSMSTLRRHCESGKLVVEKITPKLWRIRLDTLRRFTGKR